MNILNYIFLFVLFACLCFEFYSSISKYVICQIDHVYLGVICLKSVLLHNGCLFSMTEDIYSEQSFDRLKTFHL